MHTIIKGADREHLLESYGIFGLVFGMAAVAAIFMVVAILGLMTTM